MLRFSFFNIIILVLLGLNLKAQELFPNSEPASIIPKNAIGIRIMNDTYQRGYNWRVWNGAMVMYGVNSKLMVNAMVTASNHHLKSIPNNYIHQHTDYKEYEAHTFTNSSVNPYLFESVNVGFRYRFLNVDGDHKHFRMAAFGNALYSNRPHDEAEVTLMGDNKALGGGIIATGLIKKLAISFGSAYIKPFAYKQNNGLQINYGNALQYNLSFGYLLLPFKYKNFNQTNVNLYAEFLGKNYQALSIQKANETIFWYDTNLYGAGNYIEFRPGLQFIIKSNLRIDVFTNIRFIKQSYLRNYPAFGLNLQYYFL